jgi:G:T/U-mismatch repair DNA glycosylase
MDANVKTNQEEYEPRLASLLSRMDVQHKTMMAHGLGGNPEEMKSKAEHQEVPKEHAAVKPVGELRKRHRGRNVAAERRRKPTDGSRRKLVAVRRRTTLSAKVARRKGHSLQGQGKDKVSPRTLKSGTSGWRHQPKPEQKNGIRNRGLRQQLRGKRVFNKTLRRP